MLIRSIIFLILIYVLYRIVKSFRRAKSVKTNDNKFQSVPAVGEDLVEDPFCHTYIPVSQALKKEIAGKDFYFCSNDCCQKYLLGKNREK